MIVFNDSAAPAPVPQHHLERAQFALVAPITSASMERSCAIRSRPNGVGHGAAAPRAASYSDCDRLSEQRSGSTAPGATVRHAEHAQLRDRRISGPIASSGGYRDRAHDRRWTRAVGPSRVHRSPRAGRSGRNFEHDPENRQPVFKEVVFNSKCWSTRPIQSGTIRSHVDAAAREALITRPSSPPAGENGLGWRRRFATFPRRSILRSPRRKTMMGLFDELEGAIRSVERWRRAGDGRRRIRARPVSTTSPGLWLPWKRRPSARIAPRPKQKTRRRQ